VNKDNLLETLSGKANRNNTPTICSIGENPLPDTLKFRVKNPQNPDLKTFETGCPDEGQR
jgi:hypothetical protein